VGGSNHQDIPEGDKKEEREELHNVKESTDGGIIFQKEEEWWIASDWGGGTGWGGEDWHKPKSPTRLMENRKVESKPDFS